jgi:hypothetical protein
MLRLGLTSRVVPLHLLVSDVQQDATIYYYYHISRVVPLHLLVSGVQQDATI